MPHDDHVVSAPGDLHIANLSVTRGDVSVLRQLRLDVPGGTVAAVLGASGSGKSTLLRAVCGLLHPTSGTITVDGVDITDVPVHRRRVAMVFQDGQLFDHLVLTIECFLSTILRHNQKLIALLHLEVRD